MICNCGASCRTSDTKEGEVHTCPACGRREVRKLRLVPDGPNILNKSFEPDPQETKDMFQ